MRIVFLSINKLILSSAIFFIALNLISCQQHVGMLNPKGIIAYEERKLFFNTLALMLIVVLPVIIMSLTFVYHYQVSHRIRDYKPNWSHNYFLESLWWGIPISIIFVLAILTIIKTHELDPYKKIATAKQQPLLIQVIALPWKWLFIYPEQNIASVNYLVVPVNQQVEYKITADNVPMSDFFIPQLGSQIYAMAGMQTKLHLLSSIPGTYRGINAQYNGEGFSDMYFPVYVVEPEKMQQWINEVKNSSNPLTQSAYFTLLHPSVIKKPMFFSQVKANLFQEVIDTYMHSVGTTHPRSKQANFSAHIKQ